MAFQRSLPGPPVAGNRCVARSYRAVATAFVVVLIALQIPLISAFCPSGRGTVL